MQGGVSDRALTGLLPDLAAPTPLLYFIDRIASVSSQSTWFLCGHAVIYRSPRMAYDLGALYRGRTYMAEAGTF